MSEIQLDDDAKAVIGKKNLVRNNIYFSGDNPMPVLIGLCSLAVYRSLTKSKLPLEANSGLSILFRIEEGIRRRMRDAAG